MIGKCKLFILGGKGLIKITEGRVNFSFCYAV